jgi:hypothetical protein
MVILPTDHIAKILSRSHPDLPPAAERVPTSLSVLQSIHRLLRGLLDYLRTFTAEVKVANIEVELPDRGNTNIRGLISHCVQAPGVRIDFGSYVGAKAQAFLGNMHEHQEFCNYVGKKALRVVAAAKNTRCPWTGQR